MFKEIDILLADHQPLFRYGVRQLLLDTPGINVVGETSRGVELMALVQELNPDLIIMDLRLPDIDGLEVVEMLRQSYPEAKILVLSDTMGEDVIVHVMRLGVSGFLAKDCAMEELPLAISEIYTSGTYMTPRVQKALLHGVQHRHRTRPSLNHGITLTDREKEVLELICEGLTSAEIGERLFISPRTAEGHRKKLIAKFEVRNTAALIIKAIKDGWLAVA